MPAEEREDSENVPARCSRGSGSPQASHRSDGLTDSINAEEFPFEERLQPARPRRAGKAAKAARKKRSSAR